MIVDLNQLSLPMGRMISMTKSGYLHDYPTHIVVFNANLCTKEHGKIWFGDLDLTRDEKVLVEFQSKIGIPLYVLREMDARFENEGSPVFENYVAKIEANLITLNQGPRN